VSAVLTPSVAVGLVAAAPTSQVQGGTLGSSREAAGLAGPIYAGWLRLRCAARGQMHPTGEDLGMSSMPIRPGRPRLRSGQSPACS
jgi:hypothetical protein